MIPKIIHQTGPDKEKWHPIWKECQQSWKDTFPDFQYVYWTDEDLKKLIKDNYPQFYKLCEWFPYHIMRVDFLRFCILHKFGGIYVDLDIYCYKNFYNLLKNDLYILESWKEWGEKVQNSLMISNQGNDFWIKCMNCSLYKSNHSTNFDIFNFNNSSKKDYVLSTTGPKMISNILDERVKFLPKELFNPKVDYQFNNGSFEKSMEDFESLKNDDKVYTRHYLTSVWNY